MKREKKIRPYVPSRKKTADPDAITFNDKLLEKFREDWVKESQAVDQINIKFIINSDGTIKFDK